MYQLLLMKHITPYFLSKTFSLSFRAWPLLLLALFSLCCTPVRRPPSEPHRPLPEKTPIPKPTETGEREIEPPKKPAEPSQNERPPTHEPPPPATGPLLSSYNVVYMLPFMANRFNGDASRISGAPRWSLQFYAGARMALDELSFEGVKLDVKVMDTQGAEPRTRALLRERDLEQAHLIIGPYRRDNIILAADFAKRRGINLVSPYSAIANLTRQNPHFMQMRPSMETHCAALLNHALRKTNPRNIILVARDNPTDRQGLRYFQEAYYLARGDRFAPPLTEYVISSGSDNPSFEPYLAQRDSVVLLVSAWSPEDETFVYTLLLRLDQARRPNQNVVVYGTPAWMSYERVDLSYYEKFNLHISSNFFVDTGSEKARAFRRAFFDRFGMPPPEEAFLGYDLTLYFGRMLNKYGPQFQLALEREPVEGIHTRLDFERVVIPTTTGAENAPIEFFENKYVHILQFLNYGFEPSH
jgi:hypothetical protein